MDGKSPLAQASYPERSADVVEPFGDVGAETDRGPDGRFTRGNTAALVVGQFSSTFWRAADARYRELQADLLRDRGHSEDDAPAALRAAVDGAAQAILLRDGAFLRVLESGGPVTPRERRRTPFKVWCEAADRAEKHLRLVGIERQEKPVDPVEGLRRAVEEANR